LNISRQKSALKEKRRLLNERLAEQSAKRKAKLLEKVAALPDDLLEVAQELQYDQFLS
jgi:hypothetical protein